MANIHVLESPAPGRFRVAYHVAIPASNNPAGVAWRTAIVNSRDATRPVTVLPDGDGTNGTISAAEKGKTKPRKIPMRDQAAAKSAPTERAAPLVRVEFDDWRHAHRECRALAYP